MIICVAIRKIAGKHGGIIRIKLRARAVEKKANATLLNFLATRLKISKRAVVLERGQRWREKVSGSMACSEEEPRRRLLRPG